VRKFTHRWLGGEGEVGKSGCRNCGREADYVVGWRRKGDDVGARVRTCGEEDDAHSGAGSGGIAGNDERGDEGVVEAKEPVGRVQGPGDEGLVEGDCSGAGSVESSSDGNGAGGGTRRHRES